MTSGPTWLEISVHHAHVVAVVDGINDLKEDLGDESVLADVALLLGDHPEQVAWE